MDIGQSGAGQALPAFDDAIRVEFGADVRLHVPAAAPDALAAAIAAALAHAVFKR